MNKTEKVVDVVLPADDESAEVMEPSKQPFHLPAPPVAAEGPAILGLAPAAPVGRDHFDAVDLRELPIELVRIIGLVADEPVRHSVEEASGQNILHKLAFGWRSAVDSNGEGKTVTSGDSDDLRALAAPGGADGKAPFFALANVASTNASSRFNVPFSCRCRANRLNAASNLPLRTHCWKRRWQVWYGGYLSGNSRHCAPVPSTQSTPFNTARVSCQGRPRLSARRCGRSTGSTAAHCSSLNSHRPRMRSSQSRQSAYRIADFTLFEGL